MASAVEQWVFDHSVTQLLRQGQRVIDTPPPYSTYHNGPDRHCAIGMLMNYHQRNTLFFGEFGWRNSQLDTLLGAFSKPLLRDLERVHDNYTPNQWMTMFRVVAKKHGLSTRVLDEVSPWPPQDWNKWLGLQVSDSRVVLPTAKPRTLWQRLLRKPAVQGPSRPMFVVDAIDEGWTAKDMLGYTTPANPPARRVSVNEYIW